MRKVATEFARRHADAVDREGRFPHETFDALKAAGLMSVMVPTEFGGEGASLAEVAALCHILGQYCSSSGLIYAMHQIQVAGVVRHGQETPWHRHFLEKLAREQLLLASATTEYEVGGDVRTSKCAVEISGERLALSKNTSVISYGAIADAILVTARRSPDAASSDQVIVTVLKTDYRLDYTGGWDTMGMRGTCSDGYWLHADADVQQIIPLPFAEVSARTMLPTTHILWSAVWSGIAANAVARARAFIRAAARKKPGSTPPGAIRLAEAVNLLQQMKSSVVAAIRRYEAAMDEDDGLTSLSFVIEMNNLKISAAEMVVKVVQQALLVCGLSGYRNDGEYTLSRHLRDAYSAALMVNNDRIYANTANLLLVHKEATGLFE